MRLIGPVWALSVKGVRIIGTKFGPFERLQGARVHIMGGNHG